MCKNVKLLKTITAHNYNESVHQNAQQYSALIYHHKQD